MEDRISCCIRIVQEIPLLSHTSHTKKLDK